MNNLQYDVAIIGAGSAGLYTSFMLSMFGLKSCIIDSSKAIGGQCATIYPEKPIFDIPGYTKILARDLVDNLHRQIRRFETNFYLSNAVESVANIDDQYTIYTKSNKIAAKAIVLAIGEGEMKPRKLDISNINILEEKKYIHYTFSNLHIFRGKKVAIAGGGDSAADCAIELANIASEVAILHRRRSLRCMDATRHHIEELMLSGKLDVHLSTNIKSINELSGGITIVFEKNNELQQQNFDYCIVCYGSEASKTILDKLPVKPKLNQNQEIIIDSETCLTSEYNIYAVGDCTGYATNSRPKFISIGFAEASLAAYHIRKNIFSYRHYEFKHSTDVFSS